MKSRFRFFLFFIVLFFASCSRNMYLPSVEYVPQLRDKNDAEIATTFSRATGLSAQTAWAFSDHFGIQVQGNAVSFHNGDVLGGISYRDDLFKPQENLYTYFSIAAGYSGGQNKNALSRETGGATEGIGAVHGYAIFRTDSRWHGAFLQTSAGFIIDKNFTFYGSFRWQLLNCSRFHYSVETFALDPDQSGVFHPGVVQQINSRNGHTTLYEPCIGSTFGWKHFQFFAQIQWRYQYTGENLNDHWKAVSVGLVQTGLVYRFCN